MALARMLSLPHSLASTCVSEMIAALLTLYMPRPGSGLTPPILEMFTMAPPPRARKCGRAALEISKGARTFTAMILSKAPGVVSSTGPNTGFTAALLTRMSRPPNIAAARATMSSASPSFETLQAMPPASAPAAFNSATVASTASCLRLTATTLAPARAKARAIAFPMPRVPPVTSAILPSREKRSAGMRAPELGFWLLP